MPLVCVIKSFSIKPLIADCTELADGKLYFFINAEEVILDASFSLAIACSTNFCLMARLDNISLYIPAYIFIHISMIFTSPIILLIPVNVTKANIL